MVTDHRVDAAEPVTDAVVWDAALDPLLLEVWNLFPMHTAVFRRPVRPRLDPGLPATEDWDLRPRLPQRIRLCD
ncbi:hypothetical protein ACWDKQ_16835 [Saccharopolyspora sp. NPDC000995]